MRTRIALVLLVAFALASGTAVGSTETASGDRQTADAAKKKKKKKKKKHCASGKRGKRCRHRARCARKAVRRRPKGCRARKHRTSPAPAPRPGDPDPSPDPAPGDPPTGPSPPPLGRSMSVTAREWTLAQSRAALAAGTQAIELRNWGEDPHNLVIGPDDGSHVPLFTWPDTPSLELFTQDTALGPGRYLLWCSLEGHEAAGMKTTVRVE